MSDFFEIIKERCSCRAYSAKPIEREKIEKCIDAARLSPSACNSQPWFYTVVTSGEMTRKVAQCLQRDGANKFTDNVPVFAVVSEKNAELKPSISGKVENQKFAQIDIGLSIAHFCLAAQAQGLSSCIIGWMEEDKLHEVCGIAPEDPIRAVIALGYAAGNAKRSKIRKSIGEMSEFI